jgi:hypothetical protein
MTLDSENPGDGGGLDVVDGALSDRSPQPHKSLAAIELKALMKSPKSVALRSWRSIIGIGEDSGTQETLRATEKAVVQERMFTLI